MFTFVKSLLKKLFSAPEGPRSALRVIGWWERRRIIYNMIVGSIGFISLAFFLFFLYSSFLEPGEDASEPLTFFITIFPKFLLNFWVILGILALMILINIAYTAGWASELILRHIFKDRARHIGPILLFMGLTFSLIVVILPAVFGSGIYTLKSIVRYLPDLDAFYEGKTKTLGHYDGYVYDIETKKPIKGAQIYATWENTTGGILGPYVTETVAVVTAETDIKGYYHLPAVKVPLYGDDWFSFWLYKSGYITYSNWGGFGGAYFLPLKTNRTYNVPDFKDNNNKVYLKKWNLGKNQTFHMEFLPFLDSCLYPDDKTDFIKSFCKELEDELSQIK